MSEIGNRRAEGFSIRGIRGIEQSGRLAPAGRSSSLHVYIYIYMFWIGTQRPTTRKCMLLGGRLCARKSFVPKRHRAKRNARHEFIQKYGANFPTFFHSKRTSRCPKLVPNDYFCSRGVPFSMGLGKVSLSCRNP